MKKLVTLMLAIGILILPVLAMAVESENLSQDSPVAVVLNPEYDFGSAVEGTEVVHDYILKNTGTAPLNIEKVKTG